MTIPAFIKKQKVRFDERKRENGEKMPATYRERFIRGLCEAEFIGLQNSNVYGKKDCNGTTKVYAVHDRDTHLPVPNPLEKAPSTQFQDTRLDVQDGTRDGILNALNTSPLVAFFNENETRDYFNDTETTAMDVSPLKRAFSQPSMMSRT